MFDVFAKEVAGAVNPFAYKSLSRRGAGKGFKFVFKILLFVYIISLFLYIPRIAETKDLIARQLTKLDMNVTGTFSTNQPIAIPEEKPWIVVDTNPKEKLRAELIIVTDKDVVYRTPTGTRKVALSEFKDIAKNREAVADFFAFLLLLLTPTVAFLGYVYLAFRYMIIAILAGMLGFILLDLTQHKVPFRRVMATACYSLMLPIAIEVISLPLNTEWLVQAGKVWGFPIFIVTSVIYLVWFIAALIVVWVDARKQPEEESL